MKTISKTLLASALVAASGVAQAEVSANIAAVSDYLFRGVSQSSNAAVQGGFDFAAETGLYAGTWISNVDFGGEVETDLYGGYSGEMNGIGFDIGGIYYWYPDSGGDQTGSELDYAEVALGLSYGPISAGIAYTAWGEVSNAPFDSGDLYYNISGEVPLEGGFSASAVLGYYDFDSKASGQEASYAHWGASLAKDVGEFGSVSVNYEQTDGDSDQPVATDDGPKIWLGWSKEF